MCCYKLWVRKLWYRKNSRNLDKEAFSFVNIYRLQGVSIKTFLEDLDDCLCETNNRWLNIEIYTVSKDIDSYVLLTTRGLKSVINSLTHITKFDGNCFVHIFIRSCISKNYSWEGSFEGIRITDHCVMSIRIRNIKLKSISKTNVNPQFWLLNYIKWNDALRFEYWDSVNSETNPSVAYTFQLVILIKL